MSIEQLLFITIPIYLAMIVGTIAFAGYMRGRVKMTGKNIQYVGGNTSPDYTSSEYTQRQTWELIMYCSCIWPIEIFCGLVYGAGLAIKYCGRALFDYAEYQGKQSIERDKPEEAKVRHRKAVQ